MAADFRIDTLGGHAVEAKLAALAAIFGDLTPLMQHLGGVMEYQTAERFRSETAPDGSRWKPSIRARQDGGRTLDTGRPNSMARSITREVTASSVRVGTNIIYAGVHQDGAKIRAKSDAGLRFQLPGKLGWRRMMEVELPARSFLGLSDDNAEELIEATEDFVIAEMGGMP